MENTATHEGGGIHNANVFTMSGGTVSANTSVEYGGGIYNKGKLDYDDNYNTFEVGSFIITGGTVSGNTAGTSGGGILLSDSVLKLSGNAVVTGNVEGGTITEGMLSGGSVENVNLFSDSWWITPCIAIGKAFTGKVGVTSGNTDYPTIIAKADGDYVIFATDAKSIVSDNSELKTSLMEGNVVLNEKSGGLTASNFVFTPPTTLTYDGTEKVATVVSKDSVNVGTVKYYKDGIETAPVDADTYTVKIDVEANDDYYAEPDISDAAWTFTVEQRKITVTASPSQSNIMADSPFTYTIGNVITLESTVLTKLGHDFTEKIIDAAHLKSAPTCTSPAVYYYDCSRCAEMSDTLTSEDGTALGHDFTGEYDGHDETCHWHICNRDNCNETDTKMNHSGGIATYFEKATCEVCGQQYGSTVANTTVPTGEIKIESNHWNEFLNRLPLACSSREPRP